jgi:hypothetical protein
MDYEDYGDCPLSSVWWEEYEEDIEDVSDFDWGEDEDSRTNPE